LKTPSERALAALQNRLGYSFADASLLQQALTHRSAARDNNERLEFLGDALVGLVAARAFYQCFPDEDEGVLSRLRASVVRRESLAAVARELGLSDCIILGESERKSGGKHRDSILADALEALAGAVWLDSTTEQAERVVGQWLSGALEQASPEGIIDPKTRLQEWLQARGESRPEYEVVEVSGEDHDQSFRVRCSLADRRLAAEAVGSARRRAEQLAAEAILSQLLETPNDG